MSAKAVYLRTDVHALLTPQPRSPGEWRFVDPQTYEACAPPAPGQEGLLHFACVRRAGMCGYIRIGNGFKPVGEKTWKWNGSVDKPTLEPSINCLACNPKKPEERYAGCGWHAFLTDGTWTGD